MKKIHIVGCSSRSGTTLITEALQNCFKVDGYVAHEAGLLERQQTGVKVRLTKHPRDVVRVKPFLQLDPDMHVIAMMRDPRDVVVSRHGKAPDLYWTGLVYWLSSEAIIRGLMHFKHFHVIRYEDLVSKPDDIQKQIEAWLPWLEKTADFSGYHLHAKVSGDSDVALRGVRAISNKGVGAWKNNLGRVVQQINMHGSITTELIRWGYETDTEWDKVLMGIDPDETPSYRPEVITSVSRWKSRRRYLRACAVALFRDRFV